MSSVLEGTVNFDNQNNLSQEILLRYKKCTYLNDVTIWFIRKSSNFKVSSLTQHKRYFPSEIELLLCRYM